MCNYADDNSSFYRTVPSAIWEIFSEFLIFCDLSEISEIRGSEFSRYEIKFQNRVMQNYVTLRVTNSKIFIEILLLSY